MLNNLEKKECEENSLEIYYKYIDNIWNMLWFKTNINLSVKPKKEYENYSVSFMWAVNNPNIYLTEVSKQIILDDIVFFEIIDNEWNKKLIEAGNFIPNEINISNCIRLDSLNNAWKSKKHLTSFWMFNFSWIWERKEIIKICSDFLLSFFQGNKNINNIIVYVHNDDIESKKILIENNFNTKEDNGCIFNSNKTNRKWYRLEFKIEFTDTNWNINLWEVLNLVIIDKIGNENLNFSIYDWWGAMERLIAIKEWKSDIFQIQNFEEYKKTLHSISQNEKERSLEKIIDQTKTSIIMLLSWYELWNQNKQNKSFRSVIRELAFTKIEHWLDYNSLNWLCKKIIEDYRDKNTPDSICIEGIINYIQEIESQFLKVKKEIWFYLSIFNINSFEIKIIICVLLFKYAWWSWAIWNLVLKNIWSNQVYNNNIEWKNISECDIIYKKYNDIKKMKTTKINCDDAYKYFNVINFMS